MSTLLIRQKLINIAHAEIGTVETPPGSNKGKRVREYQSTCTLAEETPTGWPWCAAFVCWCIREWLKDKEVLDAYDEAKRHQRDTETELKRFETELEASRTNLEGLRLQRVEPVEHGSGNRSHGSARHALLWRCRGLVQQPRSQ